ncbi:MAG: hypothetical protein GQ532_10910 [Methylomarinum sp.]|nr:hypothetical protein [Methylomarinum sp.]
MLIVGIGASTGGLEALNSLLSNLPEQEDVSYIVVHHMLKDSPRILVEQLCQQTSLTVEEVVDGVVPRSGTLHLAPNDCDIFLSDGCLRLKPASSTHFVPCIDQFFTSLAQEQQSLAIGIVLSGNGHDGAYGVQALRQAGGVTIAQDPVSARFPDMPQAAIEIGGADLTLSPQQAAKQLPSIAKRLTLVASSDTKVDISSIIDGIHTATGLDFVNYKQSTINRQIQRRMAILQIADIQGYCDYIKANPHEYFHLSNNFLICVTSFFRNKQCFKALKQALQEVIRNKTPGDDIRIWSPGCATGEEVYSNVIKLSDNPLIYFVLL